MTKIIIELEPPAAAELLAFIENFYEKNEYLILSVEQAIKQLKDQATQTPGGK